MKKTTKALLFSLCAVLLVGASIAGTVAYLTSSDTVTNTFTVGNVTIDLKENKIDPSTGALVDSDPNQDGIQTTYEDGIENIKIVPGRTIQKQPVVIVKEGSENCWLFVKVTGEVLNAGSFTVADGWTAVENENGWYQKNGVATVGYYPVFEEFTFKSDLKNEDVEALKDKTILVTAYAIQSEGVAQDAAFTTAKGMTP